MKIRNNIGFDEVFDPIRKKWVKLNPEEWVRQQLIILLLEKLIPIEWISVEKELNYYNSKKRFDLLVIRPSDQKILLLAECKAPEIDITLQTFEQISLYHAVLKPRWWLLTNGVNRYLIQPTQSILLQEIPNFEILCENF